MFPSISSVWVTDNYTVRPIPNTSAVQSTHAIGGNDLMARPRHERAWYRNPWDILGVGALATTATIAIDRPVNNYAENHIGYTGRHDFLDAADAMTWGMVAIAGSTWFQSPWAGPKLARASSVAILATTITTLEVEALKFATGRARPNGTNGPTDFHFFSTQYSNPIGGAQFFSNANTSSFPSGHTAVIWSLVTPYAQAYHNPWLYAIPITASLARITTPDGHWASDVVGGAVLGYLTADLTNEYFPKTDFGVIFFGDGVELTDKF
jgi:membrane-associated phospholipid phosphatase